MQVGLLLFQPICIDILNDSSSGVIQIRERQHVRPAFQASLGWPYLPRQKALLDLIQPSAAFLISICTALLCVGVKNGT